MQAIHAMHRYITAEPHGNPTPLATDYGDLAGDERDEYTGHCRVCGRACPSFRDACPVHFDWEDADPAFADAAVQENRRTTTRKAAAALGRRIRQARLAKGLSQSALAKLIGGSVPATLSAISDIEHGTRRKGGILQAVCAALEVEPPEPEPQAPADKPQPRVDWREKWRQPRPEWLALGQQIRTARIAARLSQTELARMCGASHGKSIGHVEQGKRCGLYARKACDVLGIDMPVADEGDG